MNNYQQKTAITSNFKIAFNNFRKLWIFKGKFKEKWARSILTNFKSMMLSKIKNWSTANLLKRMNPPFKTKSYLLFMIISPISSRSTRLGKWPIPLLPTFSIWSTWKQKREQGLKFWNLLKISIKNLFSFGSFSKTKRTKLNSKTMCKSWDLNSTKHGNKSTSSPPNTFLKESTETGTKLKVKLEMLMERWA